MRSLTLDRRTVVIGLLIAAAHLIVSLIIVRPLILPDEAGYLLNARRIATLGPPAQLVYFPGYSLVIAPIFSLSSDLAVVFKAAQATNAVLAGLSAVTAVVVARRMFIDLTETEALVVALVVGAYPSYMLFSSLAVSENLFIPAVLVCLVLFLRFAEVPTAARVVWLGTVSGLSIMIHQRAVALALAAIIGLIVHHRDRVRLAVLGVVATLAGLSVGVILAIFIVDPSSGTYEFGISARTSVGGLITDNLGLRALSTLPFTILGQLFYVAVATLGLAPVAARWVGQNLPTAGRENRSSASANAATWLATLGMSTILIAGLFMNQGTGDKAVYGRYLEGILAPFLLVGAVHLIRRAADRSLLPLIVFPAAASAVLLAVRGADAFVGRQQLLNIATIEPVVRLVGIDVFWIAVVGVAGSAAVFESVRRWGSRGLLVIFGLWTMSTAFVFERAVGAQRNVPDVQELSGVLSDELLPLVKPSHRCVAVDDAATASPWFQQNYRLELLDVVFERWDSEESEPPCGSFALTSRPDLETILPGATLVGVEPTRNFLVWYVGDGDDLLGPAPVGSPSPTGFLEQADRIMLSEPRVIEVVDQTVHIEVTLTNTTEHVLVPSLSIPNGLGGIAVGLEWKTPGNSERLHEPRRASLPELVKPGQEVVLSGELPFEIPGDDFELTPGEWDIHVEVVQEGWRWIGSDAGRATRLELPPWE